MSMMVYILDWRNGLEGSDRDTTTLGIYSTGDKVTEATAHYEQLIGKQWPFNKEGQFTFCTVMLDEHMVEVHPKVVL